MDSIWPRREWSLRAVALSDCRRLSLSAKKRARRSSVGVTEYDAVSNVMPRKENFWEGVSEDFSLWGEKPSSLAVITTC